MRICWLMRLGESGAGLRHGEPPGGAYHSAAGGVTLGAETDLLVQGREAMPPVPTAQVPGVYHRRIGDIVVTALSDGYLDGTVEVMQNIAPENATQLLTNAFRPGRRTSVNCYLIYSAGRLALIETGSGDYLMPTAGKLQQNLKAAGVDPADIEAVILTHMHPDHSAGLTDPKT